MNSDTINSITSSVESVLSPVVNYNKFVTGFLVVFLVSISGYYLPHPLLPKVVMDAMQNYKALSFVVTLTLAYVVTKDINVAMVTAILVFALSYLSKHVSMDVSLNK